MPEDTACRAYICSKECAEFIPGPKLGRDTWPSCKTCTHSPGVHKPLVMRTTKR